MNDELERQLTEALDSLDEGVPMEAIVIEHSEVQGKLLPLLQTATYIRDTLRYVKPATSAGMAAGRRRMLAAAAAKHTTTSSPRWPTALAMLQSWFRTPARSLATIVLLLALLIPVVGLTTAAAASSLPGDLLYPVKRATEQVRLSLTADPAGKALLYAQFNRERQSEARAIAALGRRAQLQFDGVLQRQSDGTWNVDGIPLFVDHEMAGDMPVQGSTVVVDVMAPGDGTLHMQHLTIRNQPPRPPGEPPALQRTSTPTAGGPMPKMGDMPTVRPSVMGPKGVTIPAGQQSSSGMGQPMGSGESQSNLRPEATATLVEPMMGQPTPTAQAMQQPNSTLIPAPMSQPGDSGGSGSGSSDRGRDSRAGAGSRDGGSNDGGGHSGGGGGHSGSSGRHQGR